MRISKKQIDQINKILFETSEEFPELSAEIRTITPAEAKKMMEISHAKGYHNRPISNVYVKRYAELMRAGEWLPAGNPIQLTADGGLLNGWHRLSAVVLAGSSVPFTIIRGVDPKAFHVYDCGRPRRVGDRLYIEGYTKYYTDKAAGARLICRFLQRGTFLESGTVDPTYPEISRTVGHYNLEMDVPCTLAHSKNNMNLIKTSVLVALWILFGTIDANKREEFFSGVYGNWLPEDDPRKALRNVLINAKSGARLSCKMHAGLEAAYVICAWNEFRAGNKAATIMLPTDGSYPKIDGLEVMKLRVDLAV